MVDPVTAMHAAFLSSDTPLEKMERLRAKFRKTVRDDELAQTLDTFLMRAIERADIGLPPGFDNRKPGSAVALIGPTGVGKTTALNRYFSKNEWLRGYRDPASTSPLISVTAPSPCTSMQLARVILTASGYPIERDLPAHRLWEMAFDRLQKMKKFLLHIDELQHVVQYANDKDKQEIANILKHAMEGQKISLVISGINTLVPFLQFDEQLFRRLTFVQFENLTPNTHGIVTGMVSQYAEAAGLQVNLGDPMTRDEFAGRLSHAALKAFGYSIVITLLAIENALQSKSAALSQQHFANVFARKTGFSPDRNPFLIDRWFDVDCSQFFAEKTILEPPRPAERSSKGKKK